MLRVLPVRNYFLLDPTVKGKLDHGSTGRFTGSKSHACTVAPPPVMDPCGYSLDDFADVKRRTFEGQA